jgi:hypothetical protein
MKYIPASQHGPADNLPITRIVMHGTVSPCVKGGARAVAHMFATSSRDASTQYIVDPGEIVQAVPDSVVAYGAPPNKGAIHVEQCDMQAGPGSRWQDANHQAMLHLAAELVAGKCLKYGIPIRKINAADLRAGRKGICGHKDVSEAWHQTDHVDPGPDYPWAQFLSLVESYAHPKPNKPAITPKVKRMLVIKDPTRTGTFLTDLMTKHWIHNPEEETHVKNAFKILGIPWKVYPVVPGSILSSYGVIDSGGFPPGYTTPLPTDEEH